MIQAPRLGTEADYLRTVLEAARLAGWWCHHCRPALTKDGRWVTAISGDRGYPDICMAHPSRGVMFVELKKDGRPVPPEQERWLTLLADAAPAFVVHVPSGLDALLDIITGRAAA